MQICKVVMTSFREFYCQYVLVSMKIEGSKHYPFNVFVYLIQQRFTKDIFVLFGHPVYIRMHIRVIK